MVYLYPYITFLSHNVDNPHQALLQALHPKQRSSIFIEGELLFIFFAISVLTMGTLGEYIWNSGEHKICEENGK
ncbi:MAG: hypothetical protein A4E52_01066 [Pelotomaculum sp. PtaB.Bin013]|nr:MAG: hypothetical protein A4E52_01066 [Pelotomaculum sp. PtaB.Bin013]